MTEPVIRQATLDDWPVIAEQGARTFKLPGGDAEARYQAALNAWQGITTDPTFKVENSWLAIVDGQIAAHVSFVERVLCYGSAELSFGGIAGVMTRPEFRGRGYAYALMRVALDDIQQRGHMLAMLDGIRRFYDRLGFTPLWYFYGAHFEVKEVSFIAEDTDGYRVRELDQADIPVLHALYEAEWAARPWRIRRSEDWLRYKLNVPSRATYVVEDANGTICGYSTGHMPEDRTEVAVTNQAAAAALMRHTAELLADQPDCRVKWLDLPNTQTARFMRRLCSVDFTTWVSHRGGWMGRFIDVQRALDTLRPELVARWVALGVPQAETTRLEALDDTVTLQVNGLACTVSHNHFLQLAFGFLSPADIDDLLSATVDAAGRDLLKQLFPPVVNGFAGLDWF